MAKKDETKTEQISAVSYSPKKWKVVCSGVTLPDRIVEAETYETAIDAYKASLGIIELPVSPTVTEVE
jgi:hypothetical protein